MRGEPARADKREKDTAPWVGLSGAGHDGEGGPEGGLDGQREARHRPRREALVHSHTGGWSLKAAFWCAFFAAIAIFDITSAFVIPSLLTFLAQISGSVVAGLAVYIGFEALKEAGA